MLYFSRFYCERVEKKGSSEKSQEGKSKRGNILQRELKNGGRSSPDDIGNNKCQDAVSMSPGGRERAHV